MTRAQIRKLETILAKVETLQGELTDPREREQLGDAKTVLLRALRDADGGA